VSRLEAVWRFASRRRQKHRRSVLFATAWKACHITPQFDQGRHMKKGSIKMAIVSLLAMVLASGCASTSSQQGHEQPPPKANRVQVAMYDTTPRAPTTSLDYYGVNRPTRPYKVIALLTCEGAPDQEVIMTAAIYYRARQMGANAVQDAGTIRTMSMGYYFFYSAPNPRCTFRDYAIVYTDQ
jgi:hypothetical protein